MANEMDESMTDYLEMSFPFNMDNASNACADSDLHLPNQMYGATGYIFDCLFY
jgi:hypothetical protein